MIDIHVKRKQGDFTVDAGFSTSENAVTALFGTSGAGKTSVINMIAGLLRPDSGRIAVKDRVLFDSEKGVDVPPEKRRIGYIFQDGRLFPHLSVRANLVYGMKLTPRPERFVKFDQVVDMLGLGHLLERRPARLSGGEKQRAAIGRALLASPSLLLMDEPLASLDGPRKAEILPFIAGICRQFELPVFYVSHSPNEILNLADRLVLMANGKVAASGDIEELMNRPDLRRLTGHFDHGAVISTTVEKHDDPFGLTHLRFAGGVLKTFRYDIPEKSRVRVRIPARSVSIALEKPVASSIQNIFPGTVVQIVESNRSFVDILLDIGAPLLARVTHRAVSDLDLKPGRRVFALIKSISVSHGEFDSK